MSRPAKKRLEVYGFIKQFKREHDGCSPTYGEISRHFGWSSAAAAQFHIQGLIRAGLVSLDDRSRIVLVGGRYIAPAYQDLLPDDPGFVYLLKSGPDCYKIGLTNSPERRIERLEIQLPWPIECVHLIECQRMYIVERQLHHKFADKRMNGEWFRLTEADVQYIKSLNNLDQRGINDAA